MTDIMIRYAGGAQDIVRIPTCNVEVAEEVLRVLLRAAGGGWVWAGVCLPDNPTQVARVYTPSGGKPERRMNYVV